MNTSIEALKTQLKEQKLAIEAKGGTVTVAKNNVSPAEITAGIKTIPTPDLTEATATVDDVVEGKTFYAQNGSLKMGKFVSREEEYSKVFLLLDGGYSQTAHDFYLPSGITTIPAYCFAGSKSKLNIYLNSELTKIDKCAFYLCQNIYIKNFTGTTSVKNVEYGAFQNSKDVVYFDELPSGLEYLADYAFYGYNSVNRDIIIPNTVREMGAYVFASNRYISHPNVVFPSSLDVSYFPMYAFQNCGFDIPLTIPDYCVELGIGFNYGGSFTGVSTFHSNMQLIYNRAFGAPATDALSRYKVTAFVFEGVTCPLLKDAIASQYFKDDFKIYVPDEAVEAYKAHESLSDRASYIYPMSQKP